MLDRRLKNGARLVVLPAESGPVAIQLWILAGTASERAREHGCAHLLEHMLFKPTSARGAAGTGGQFDIASGIEALAGDVNAFTSHDETVFHATVPSDAVRAAMDVLVGAVADPRFDPDELRRETRVVVQEIRQADDDPGGRVGQELLELVYRDHAYGRAVLGTKREVLDHDVRRLTAFHRSLYTADRAVLVVAGPVDPDAIGATAQRLLRRLPPRGRRSPVAPPKPAVRPRLQVRTADVAEAHLGFAWSAPALLRAGGSAAETEDACALEVASVVLGYGEASRLSEHVRRKAGLVTDAFASFYASRVSSALVVAANATGRQASAAASAILDEVESLRQAPISPEELQRAQAVIRSEVVYRQETVQGRAHALGYQISLSGDIAGERRYFDAVDALTPAAVVRACAKHLAPARTSVCAVAPRRGPGSAKALRVAIGGRLRQASRRPTPPKLARRRGGIVAVDFRCGLRLRVLPRTAVPMAAGWLVWTGGLRAEQARDLGASAIMTALLTRGNAAQSGDTLAREMDGMAAVLEGFSGRNSAGMHFECLSRDLEVVLRRAVECAAAPRFDADELEEERRVALEELAAEGDDAGGRAFAEAYRVLYRGHPYGWRRRGSEASLRRLTAQRVRTLWSRGYPLGRAVLGLAGDVDIDAVVQMLSTLLPTNASEAPPPWSPTPPKYPRRPVQRTLGGAREQAHLVRVYPGLALDDPRIYALELLTTILGGQSGRLFHSLREDKGLVYHVSAGASEGLDAGHVSFYAATSHRLRKRALNVLDAEIERIVAEPVGRDELARAKAWLCGQFGVETQRRSRLASALAFDEAYGMGAGLFLSFPKRIRAVKLAEVSAVARELLDPGRAVTVVAEP